MRSWACSSVTGANYAIAPHRPRVLRMRRATLLTPPVRPVWADPQARPAPYIRLLALVSGFNPALISTEFVVAITVLAMLVPSAMAFGDLAGVTPVAGLYVALGAEHIYPSARAAVTAYHTQLGASWLEPLSMARAIASDKRPAASGSRGSCWMSRSVSTSKRLANACTRGGSCSRRFVKAYPQCIMVA
jgi:hypothetical protein